MKIRILLFVLVAATIKPYAKTPIDSLQQVLKTTASSAEKSKAHEKIARYWAGEQQQEAAEKHIQQMLSFAEKDSDELFQTQITAANTMLLSLGDFEHAKQLNNNYLEKFKKENNKTGQAVCYYNLGRIQGYIRNLSKAYGPLTKALLLAEGNNELKVAISISLGDLYNLESRYTDALQILTDALEIVDKKNDVRQYCGLLFTIGNTYGLINDPKTALQYYQDVLSICKETGDLMGQANTLTNMASANSELKNYPLSETYIREALAIVNSKNLMAEADILSILTDVLLKQHKYSELGGFYNRMNEISELTGDTFFRYLADMGMARVAYNDGMYDKAISLLLQSLPSLEEQGAWIETIPGYKILYESYRESGDYKKALEASTKYHSYMDASYNQDKVKELALLQSKLAFQKRELEHEKEQRVKNVTIVALAAIFILSVLLALFVFKNRQKRNKHKEMLLQAQLEKAAYELQISESKLDDFARRIQEKAKLIEGMQQQLALHPNADENILQQLQEATILTEDDWKRFKLLFEQVHSGFLGRIKEKYPEVSPAEIRFLTLAKLQLSTKEMAAALGVSSQSIRTNWYRIRKKFELSESLTVEELTDSI